MKKILAGFVLVVFVFTVLIIATVGPALSQEGNPVPYLKAISKLELSPNEYEKVLESTNEIRHVSEADGENTYDVVKEYMKAKGWDFKEQLGSGFVFKKDNKITTIGTRQYSRYYFI